MYKKIARSKFFRRIARKSIAAFSAMHLMSCSKRLPTSKLPLYLLKMWTNTVTIRLWLYLKLWYQWKCNITFPVDNPKSSKYCLIESSPSAPFASILFPRIRTGTSANWSSAKRLYKEKKKHGKFNLFRIIMVTHLKRLNY